MLRVLIIDVAVYQNNIIMAYYLKYIFLDADNECQ